MRRVVAFSLALAASLPPALAGCGGPRQGQPVGPRLDRLEKEVEQQKQDGARAVESYAPKVAGMIDGLHAPAADILRQLPGVADVEVLVAAPEPAHRIIHVRDWRYVPRDAFAGDLRRAADRPPTGEEIDLLYQEFLLEVELVQLEQTALLRCLAHRHGLQRVLAEGLTRQGLPAYRQALAALRDMDGRLAGLQKTYGELRGKDPDIDRDMAELVRAQRERLLELGAPARLALEGEAEVLPLDEAALLEQAGPAAPDGVGQADPAKVEARHDAQVKAALESGPIALLVLGGGHDLSASVRRLGNGSTEYIRVTTTRYREVAGRGPRR